MRSLVRMMGLKVHWDAYRELGVALQGGRTPISTVADGGLFGYLRALHDWSDDESIAILRNIRTNAPRPAKVLILEGVVQPEARNDFLLDLDIEMLVMTTGRERTRAEWGTVISGAGMRLARVIPAGRWSSILEVEMV